MMTGQKLPLHSLNEFAGWVKTALHQIYDSPSLQNHPLSYLLAEPQMDTLQRVQNLRRVLLDAINTLRPAENQPANNANWRAYQILELRYIEGLSPPEIMKKLSLSRSYFFHEHSRMVQSLTALLWDQYQEKLKKSGPTPSSVEEGKSSEADELALPSQEAENEFQRMYANAVWETVEIPTLFDQLKSIIEPMLRAREISIQIKLAESGLAIRADRILLRQALLNIISLAGEAAQPGDTMHPQTIAIEGAHRQGQVEIRVRFSETGPGMEASLETRLEVCRRLMANLEGTLQFVRLSANEREARLTWKAAEPRLLLVIDDNETLADLFSRYLAGHDWQVIAAADGATARKRIAERRPTVILLDIMMPHEDGWEFLLRIKSQEETSTIPVIVCSVLPEEKLALSLGADAYLAKPISQQALLNALARWNPRAADQG